MFVENGGIVAAVRKAHVAALEDAILAQSLTDMFEALVLKGNQPPSSTGLWTSAYPADEISEPPAANSGVDDGNCEGVPLEMVA